jgi:hypothetical protein
MSRTWLAALVLALAAPAYAQDEPAEVIEPPADEAAPADESPAEEAPAEDASSEAPAEEVASGEESSSGEPAEPWQLYFGADLVNTTLSLSVPPTDPANEFDSSMVRLRVGKRVLEAIGFELQYGIDQADEDAGEVSTDTYYGAYLVPTATLFDVLELAFPIGYGRSEYGDSGEALGSVAYGIDAEFPLRSIYDGLPDIRLTGGWMVYYQKSDARVYGANFGLRYDFKMDGLF